MFDTLFFRELEFFAHEKRKFDFINFSQFFDKHYMSPKKLYAQSIMIFLINVGINDLIIAAVDISQ